MAAVVAVMAVGSTLVMSCWKARHGEMFLVTTTTLIFHGDVADKIERIQLFKNLAIIGGLLLITNQYSRG